MQAWQKDLAIVLFMFTYWVMAAGRFHFFEQLKLSRVTAAVVSAAILLCIGSVPLEQILPALKLTTLLILLALMLVSAVFYCCGFYAYCALKVAQMKIKPQRLLLWLIIVAGVLSAWFANDVVAFAMTPMLCKGLYRRGIDARPYLYGLMGGCNAGSLATMIGSPQNIIIAEHGHLPFWHFFIICAPIALISLFIVYFMVSLIWRNHLQSESRFESEILPPVERNAFMVGLILLGAFIFGLTLPIPRWITAVIISSLVITTFWFHISEILRRVDWRVLFLFAALFIVNQAFANTGIPKNIIDWMLQHNLHMQSLSVLTGYSFIAANIVGKVPATIFLLNVWPGLTSQALYALAIMMSLAGNTILFASLANIIVAERSSVKIRFFDHLKAGIPMTLITMLIAYGYISLFF